MQINISDSEISGTSAVASSHGYHSNKSSSEMDALMNNLTLGKPSHAGSSANKNLPDGHSSAGGAKKNDFFGGKK